jgi:hypothetical protein
MQLQNTPAAMPFEAANYDDDLLTTPEAAAFLRCSVSRLTKLRVYAGPDAIPFVRSGRTIRYRRADLRAHIHARVRRSTSELCTTQNPAPAGA